MRGRFPIACLESFSYRLAGTGIFEPFYNDTIKLLFGKGVGHRQFG
jgi:hypothetical protein